MVVGWKLGILRRRAAPRDAKKMGARDADSVGIFPRSHAHKRGSLSRAARIFPPAARRRGGAVLGPMADSARSAH